MTNCPSCNRAIYEPKYCYFCGRVFSTGEQEQLKRKIWLEQKQLEEELLNDIFGKRSQYIKYNPWKYKVCALILGIVLAFDNILITVYKKPLIFFAPLSQTIPYSLYVVCSIVLTTMVLIGCYSTIINKYRIGTILLVIASIPLFPIGLLGLAAAFFIYEASLRQQDIEIDWRFIDSISRFIKLDRVIIVRWLVIVTLLIYLIIAQFSLVIVTVGS